MDVQDGGRGYVYLARRFFCRKVSRSSRACAVSFLLVSTARLADRVVSAHCFMRSIFIISKVGESVGGFILRTATGKAISDTDRTKVGVGAA